MKFVFALLVLAAVAYAKPSPEFGGELGGIRDANKDIATAAADILKKEAQMAGLVASATAIFAAETAMEAAASVENIQNSFATVTTDEPLGGEPAPAP